MSGIVGGGALKGLGEMANPMAAPDAPTPDAPATGPVLPLGF